MNPVARGLRSGRTGMIALVVPQLAEPYFAELAQAVIRAAASRGLTVLVETTEDPQMQTEIMRGALSAIADGVLLSATTAASVRDGAKVPLVLLGENRPMQYGHYVGLDNVVAARTVVRHLLEQGCTRIAPLGVNTSATAHQRYKAFRAELRAWKVPQVEGLTMHTADWSPAGGLEAVRALLATPVRPDAVFAFNDSLAYGAIRALKEAGLAIPGDVAVAGMDDLTQSAYVDPPLTSLAPDIGALADTAVSLLVDQIEQKDPTTNDYERVLTPFELRVRESSTRVAPAPGTVDAD